MSVSFKYAFLFLTGANVLGSYFFEFRWSVFVADPYEQMCSSKRAFRATFLSCGGCGGR